MARGAQLEIQISIASFSSSSGVGPRRASASPATGNAPRVNSRSPSNLPGSQPSGGQLPPGRTPARTPFGRQTYRPDLGPTPVRPMVNPMSSLSDMDIPEIDIGGTGPEGQVTAASPSLPSSP